MIQQTHETNTELSLLQALGDLSRADYEFKFSPAVRQTILDLSQKEEVEEILKLSPSYDDEARQVIFDHGNALEVRIETRLLEYWTDYGCDVLGITLTCQGAEASDPSYLGDHIPEDVAMLLKRMVRSEDVPMLLHNLARAVTTPPTP